MEKQFKVEIPRKNRPYLEFYTDLEERETIQSYMDNYDWVTDTSEKFTEPKVCCICGKPKKASIDGKLYCNYHYNQLHKKGYIPKYSHLTPNELRIEKDHAILVTRNTQGDSITGKYYVSLESLTRLIERKWHTCNKNNRPSCVSSSYEGTGKRKTITLPRFILNITLDKNCKILHLDKDNTNNRLSNLVLTSSTESDSEILQAYSIRNTLLTFRLRGEASKSEYAGQKLSNASGDNFTVIGQTDIRTGKTNKYSQYLIEFEDKTQLVVATSSLSQGSFTNPNKPSVYKIGFQGQGLYTATSYPKEYQTWGGMLQRCYSRLSDNQIRYPTYKDCSVDPRWHNFQNFCEDIQHIKGYKEWKSNTIPFTYALDKDIKVEGNKIYSKDTCMFVTVNENTLKATLTGKTYLATFLETEHTEKFWNIAQFARDNDLISSCISRCLHGGSHTHMGWSFKEVT